MCCPFRCGWPGFTSALFEFLGRLLDHAALASMFAALRLPRYETADALRAREFSLMLTGRVPRPELLAVGSAALYLLGVVVMCLLCPVYMFGGPAAVDSASASGNGLTRGMGITIPLSRCGWYTW